MAPTHKSGSGDSRKSPITIDIDSRENSPPLANVQSSSASSGATQALNASPDAQPPARRRDPNFSPHTPRHVEASGKWIIPRRPPPRPKPRTRTMRPASRPCKYPCDSCVKADTTCYAFNVFEGCDECQYGKQGQHSRVPLHLRCSAISRALMAEAAEDAAEVAWVKCKCDLFEPERTPSSNDRNECTQSEDGASFDDFSDQPRSSPDAQALEPPGSSSGFEHHSTSLSRASPSPLPSTSMTPSLPLRRPRSPSSSPRKRARTHTKDTPEYR